MNTRQTQTAGRHTVSDSDIDCAAGAADCEAEYDDMPARRAGLADRYARQKEQLRDQQRTETETPTTPEETSSTGLLSWLTATRARVQNPDQVCSERCSITGVETAPDLDSDVFMDPSEGRVQVEAIRFELDNDAYTRWYTWAPGEPDHELTKIVEFYAAGEFSRLFSADVTVDVTHKNGGAYILTPTPFERHSAHLRYNALRRLRTVDAVLGNGEAGALVEGSGSDDREPLPGVTNGYLVTPEDEVTLTLSERSVGWWFATCIIVEGLALYGAVLSAITLSPAGLILSLVAMVMGLFGLLFGDAIGPEPGDDTVGRQGIILGLKIVFPQVVVAVRAAKRAVAWIQGLNTRQTYQRENR